MRRAIIPALMVVSSALAVGLITQGLSAGWLSRGLAIFLMVGLGVQLAVRPGLRLLLASPPAILALSALFGYSVLPALVWGSGIGAKSSYLTEFSRFLGSRGEALILAFSAGCLGLLAVLSLLPEPSRTVDHGPWPRWFRWSPFLILLLWLDWEWLARRGGGQSLGRFGDELTLVLPALFCVTASLAALGAGGIGRHPNRSMIPSILAMLAMPVVGLAKIAVIHLVVLGWVRLLLNPVHPKRLVALLGAVGLLVVIALGTLDYWRGHLTVSSYPPSDEPDWLILARHVPYNALGKLGFRQLETGYCLDRLVAAHRDDPGRQTPAYFLAGLVPRFFWPDKPSLSNGHDYGVRYCAARDFPQLSSSVTLLGEPLAEAGRAGLLVALATLTVLLTGLSVLIRYHWLGPALAAALAPWMVDFDQHFAMYLANLTKVSLIQLPVWLFVLALSGSSWLRDDRGG